LGSKEPCVAGSHHGKRHFWKRVILGYVQTWRGCANGKQRCGFWLPEALHCSNLLTIGVKFLNKSQLSKTNRATLCMTVNVL